LQLFALITTVVSGSNESGSGEIKDNLEFNLTYVLSDDGTSRVLLHFFGAFAAGAVSDLAVVLVVAVMAFASAFLFLHFLVFLGNDEHSFHSLSSDVVIRSSSTWVTEPFLCLCLNSSVAIMVPLGVQVRVNAE